MARKYLIVISTLVMLTQTVGAEVQPQQIAEEDVHEFRCQNYMGDMRETAPKLIQSINAYIRSKTPTEQKQNISDLGTNVGWMKGIIESWNQSGCKPSIDTPWILPEKLYPCSQ